MGNQHHLNAVNDQRKASRKILPGGAVFTSESVCANAALTIDVSTGGLSLFLPKPVDAEQKCTISFDLPFTTGPQRIFIGGQIVSCAQSGPQSYRASVRFQDANAATADLLKTAIDANVASFIV